METNAPPRCVRNSLALLAIVLSLSGRASQAAVAPLNAEQMVGLSRQIVVAVVEEKQTRWNEQHTLIVTDYSLRVESRLRGEVPDRVTFTMPGGTLDGETHATSVSVSLQKGSRYLLFFHDVLQPQMAPVTGAQQGMFREVRGADGLSTVVAGEGDGEPLRISGKKVRFEDFVNAVRDLVRKTSADAANAALPGWRATPGDLPAKTYAPVTLRTGEPALRSPALPTWLTEAPHIGPAVESGPEARGEGAAFSPELIGGRYVWQRRQDAPVVFNQLPASFAPWSPVDQYMMGYWNVYATNLFRVLLNPTGT